MMSERAYYHHQAFKINHEDLLNRSTDYATPVVRGTIKCIGCIKLLLHIHTIYECIYVRRPYRRVAAPRQRKSGARAPGPLSWVIDILIQMKQIFKMFYHIENRCIMLQMAHRTTYNCIETKLLKQYYEEIINYFDPRKAK